MWIGNHYLKQNDICFGILLPNWLKSDQPIHQMFLVSTLKVEGSNPIASILFFEQNDKYEKNDSTRKHCRAEVTNLDFQDFRKSSV